MASPLPPSPVPSSPFAPSPSLARPPRIGGERIAGATDEHEVDRLLRELGGSQAGPAMPRVTTAGLGRSEEGDALPSPEHERLTLPQASDGRALGARRAPGGPITALRDESRDTDEGMIPPAPASDADATLVNLKALRNDVVDAGATGALTTAMESLARFSESPSSPGSFDSRASAPDARTTTLTDVRPGAATLAETQTDLRPVATALSPAPLEVADPLDVARTLPWSGAQIHERALSMAPDTTGPWTTQPPPVLAPLAERYASEPGPPSTQRTRRDDVMRAMAGEPFGGVLRESHPGGRAAGRRMIVGAVVAGAVAAVLTTTPLLGFVRQGAAVISRGVSSATAGSAPPGSRPPEAAPSGAAAAASAMAAAEAAASPSASTSSAAPADSDEADERDDIPTVAVSDLPRARRKHRKKRGAHGEIVDERSEQGRVDQAREADDGPGLLTVVCYPACDDVLIDGRNVGPSPVFKQTVALGAHKLTLKTTDPPVTREVDVSVAGAEPVVVRQAMSPAQ